MHRLYIAGGVVRRRIIKVVEGVTGMYDGMAIRVEQVECEGVFVLPGCMKGRSCLVSKMSFPF